MFNNFSEDDDDSFSDQENDDLNIDTFISDFDCPDIEME